MVSDFTHEPSFTMMPEFELCTVWVFMCYSANEYLCKQHGWTVYYVDLWLSRLHCYFTCCLLSLYCRYAQFSLFLKIAREWWNTHAVISGNRPITPYSILHGKSANCLDSDMHGNDACGCCFPLFNDNCNLDSNNVRHESRPQSMSIIISHL